MDPIVVGKFSKGDPFKPIILTLVDEELKVLLNLLNDLLSLTISLWVVGCGSGNLDAKKLVQLSHELGDKLSSMIADNFLWETMELPYVITEKPGNSY